MQNWVAKDMDNAGHKEVNIMMKSDQEAAMVALQVEDYPNKQPCGGVGIKWQDRGRHQESPRQIEDFEKPCRDRL